MHLNRYIFILAFLTPAVLRGQGLIIPSGTYVISKGNIVLQANWQNNGSFTQNTGTVMFNGNAQTLNGGPTVFNNITVGANSTTTISTAGHSLKAVLLSNGTLQAGGNLTLLSTAGQTALIDGTGAGEVLGNVTMQRYLASGFGYKYLSSPFQHATVSELADDINLGASFPTLYRYDQSLTSSGWVHYVNPSDPLVVMQGYAANFGTSALPVTADLTGVVNNHTISLPALYNNHQPYTLGFNLVGNPYPSPIDWDASNGWTKTNIDNAIYYFNAGTVDQYTGTYSSYINGVSSDGIAGNIIGAMQGFFVHVSDGTYPVTGALSIQNNARINDLNPVFHKEYPNLAPMLRLTAAFADESYPADPMVVYFEDAAGTRFEEQLDALKRLNTDPRVPNLYALSTDNAMLSICAWPTLRDSAGAIPLVLQTDRAGWVTFKGQDLERIPSHWHIYLRDATAKVTRSVQTEAPYRLYLNKGEYKDRFYLVFQRKDDPGPGPGSNNNAVFNAYSAAGRLYANMQNVAAGRCHITVTNLLGQVILRQELIGNGVHELKGPLSSGMYIVSFYAPQLQYAKKVLVTQ